MTATAASDTTTEKAEKTESTGATIVRALGLGASAALLVATLLIAFFVVALPALVGGQSLTVLTNSMAPSMPPGTLVVVRPTPFAEIAPGDIIMTGTPEGVAPVKPGEVMQARIDRIGAMTVRVA